MAYFPLFVDLSDYTCLIVGGGAVAYRKAVALKEYGSRIMITAPKFYPDFQRQSGLFLIEREFLDEDLGGMDLVVAATDDKAENLRIATLCRERRIPVNVADDLAACTFLFPALVKDEGITIGITTSGASPDMAVCLKQKIRDALPEGIGAYTSSLSRFRDRVRSEESPAVRRAVFRELAVGGMNKTYEADTLTDEVIDRLIAGKRRELESEKD